MKSPWKNNDDAFELMYDESIVVTHDDQKATLEVCVFTDNMGDTLVDEALDTNREDIQIVFKRKDWPYMSTLVRGDLIERLDCRSKKYTMSEAKYDALMGWCIYARGN